MSVTIKGMKSHEHGMCHQEYFSVENKHRLLADSALRERRVKAKQPCDAFCSLKLCCPVRAAPSVPCLRVEAVASGACGAPGTRCKNQGSHSQGGSQCGANTLPWFSTLGSAF